MPSYYYSRRMSQAVQSSSKYRRVIDGLRAIAVLSVMIFHARDSLLPGGFIGVDIFSVISGYLISKQIAAEARTGRFSLKESALQNAQNPHEC